MTKRHFGRAAILIAVAAIALLAAWFALTDLRAVWWPKNLLAIYARGAVHDYLGMRCIDVDRLVLLGDQLDQGQLNGTWISSYERGAMSYLAWRLDQGERSYYLVSSVFQDAEYAITLWDPKTSQSIDEYALSTMHGNAGATERRPLPTDLAASARLRQSSACGQSQ